METTCAAVMLLLCCLAVGEGVGVDVSQLGSHLSHFTAVRNPASENVGGREAARSYIKDRFREYGLEVASHSFNTSLLLNGYRTTIPGENIVGVAKGSDQGPMLLVGADYDTTLHSNPLEDNGAGVAAMLEVARNFMYATGPDGFFDRNKTVLFVAFDLNTKENNDVSSGQPGSYHFLHQWLWPYLNQSLFNFGGAIILDSITKFNQEQKTQYLPQGFSQTFPEAFNKIREDELKGDFLALVSRGTSQSHLLTQTFVDNYKKHRKAGLVRLQEMLIQTSAQISSETIALINHQAHYHFWTFQPSAQPSALPALLLTDTDVYRKPSEECPQPCTSEAFLTRRREQAISLICEGLVHTLLDLQTEKRPGVTGEGSSAASVAVTVAATCIMAVVAVVLH